MDSFNFRSPGVVLRKLYFSPRGNKLDPQLSNQWISSWSRRTLSRILPPEIYFTFTLASLNINLKYSFWTWSFKQTYVQILHVRVQFFANHLRRLVSRALGLHRITHIFLTFARHAIEHTWLFTDQSNAQLLTLLLPFAIARDVIQKSAFNDWFWYLPGKHGAFATSLFNDFLPVKVWN